MLAGKSRVDMSTSKHPQQIQPQRQAPSHALRPIVLAWLGLLSLSFFSLSLGQNLSQQQFLAFVVAAICWLKGHLVAHYFLEAQQAHPFIRRVLYTFFSLVPILLIITVLWGQDLAAWYASHP